MGVPGPVNDEGTVFRCVNLGWDVFSVPEKMRELDPCLHQVKVSNDVKAGQTVALEKYSNVYTGRDREWKTIPTTRCRLTH